jgi:PAS domain S-box-containing protein
VPQRISLAPIVRTVFGVTLALLVAMLAIAYLSSRALGAAVGAERAAAALVDAVGRVAITLRDMQRFERGYVVTGDSSDLAGFVAARGALGRDLDAVARLAADDSALVDDVARLREAGARAAAFLGAVVELRRTAGLTAATRRVASDSARALLGPTDSILAQIESAARARVAGSQAGALAGSRQTTRTIVLASLLAVALVSLATVVIERELARRIESQRRLLASEERYRSLFGSNPLPSWVFDVGTLRFLAVNDAAVEHYGHARERFLAMTLRDVDASGHAQRAEELAARMRRGSGAFLVRHRTADGREIDVELTPHPIDFDGRLAMLVVANDVTERRLHEHALAESERRYRELFDNAEALICTHDLDGVLLSVNPAAARALGAVPGELVGRNMREVVAPRVRPLFDEYLMQIRAVPVVEGVLHVVTRAGEERAWQYRNARFDTGDRPSYVVGTAQDVTERRRAERQLRIAKETAEAASLAKSQFLTNMSHELRTPLNSVIGFAHLLLKNKGGNLREPDLLYLQRISDNGRHLLALINDLLDLSKIEAGRAELLTVPVALERVVADALEFLEPQAHARGLVLRSVLPPMLAPVAADAARLRQVLLNLVGNAIKFTEQGEIVVEVVADPASGAPRRLDVRDTGIGIDPSRQEAIFESFQQADNTTERRYGGTGLGLTISRQLLKLMGFRVTLESAPGRGSVFSVHFG